MNSGAALEIAESPKEPMSVFDARKSIDHMKQLACTNFCVAILALAYLSILVLDNLWFTGRLESPVPRGCIENLYCKFTVRVPNPGATNYLYLKFSGLHQNFKDYTASFSARVFKDEINPSTTQVRSCKPLRTNGEMNKTFDYQGNQLKPFETAIPCGGIAFTYPDSSLVSLVKFAIKSNKERILELNEAQTIDEKFHYIMRRKQSKRSWIKLEENCTSCLLDQFANWLNLSPKSDFLKPIAIVKLHEGEDHVEIEMTVRRYS